MLRQVLAPIHPDGWKFIAVAALATIVLFLVWWPAGWAGLIVTLWMAYFFRDPWRVTPARPGLIISPADGIVVALAPAAPPPELAMGVTPVPRIGIFLNLFDVHIARAPVGGKVAARRYTKGRFVNASLDKASLDNERLALRMAPGETPEIAVVLIAGLVARRIVCPVYEGQLLAAGERIGLIRFGSRVDIYIPPPFVPLVALGQRMVGGETVLADRFGREPAQFGVAPAAVLYLWTMAQLHSVGWAIVLFYAVCCALRLARFNTQLVSETPPWAANFFSGAPAPAGAGLIMLPMFISFEWGGGWADWIAHSPYLNAVWISGVALMMISKVPTVSLKRIRIPHHFVIPTLLGIGVMAGFFSTAPWPTLAFVGAVYLASIPLTRRAAARARLAAAARQAEPAEASPPLPAAAVLPRDPATPPAS